MKKGYVLALIACVAIGVQAGDAAKKGNGKGKPVSKEKYVAQQKKMADKKGIEFEQAKIERKFNKLDKNKDGKLSADEKPQAKGKKSKGKSKGKGEKKRKKIR